MTDDIYSSDYFLQRCGGIEFFNLYKADVLKPMMQAAVLRADLKPGMKILDVGCGRGELIAHLTALGYDALGIDLAKEAIAVAQNHFPKASYRQGDLFMMDLPAQAFDRIFFLSTIEHLEDADIARFMAEFRRLLKPGGLVIVTTCTNALYLKTVTYRLRRAVVSGLNALGFKVKSPSAPRSEEDVAMHINELHYFSLQKHFPLSDWRFEIEPRVNAKLCVPELYGRDLPSRFPVRGASAFKRGLYRILMKIPFLYLFLARTHLVRLSPVRPFR